ncbi:hypothetical protein HPDFL43_06050 [Hoeflea phototrophica DFL-43]|jgi:hypothetical protein|uniref:Uncharacterized protein n=1 Tax=Hoeflea phototrophica (strain DSM 17068 / NCIMB 14078 / DFL-43) TaxID=411684 RepID=A9D4Z0_HOEPD|nr:hypothetical protein [Hoeflea phototrophica]EDQ33993.2 hypothetical protein HPDFL43_06050 [Hoeflea phototrophica DFL-43]
MQRRLGIALFSVVATVALAGPASAISRIQTTGQSCAAIKQVLANEGAAILRYPSKRTPGITLYDRYVANANSCLQGEVTQRATVPAKDTNSCAVLRCFRPDYDDNEFFRRR